MRTVDVARESGYSVQQVRDLERLGVIPPAGRSANGYRSYTPLHVCALRAYRGLAAAAGPVAARRMLAGLRGGTLTEAAAAVNAVHVGLAREREEALRALEALRVIEAETHAPGFEREGDAMTITELAGALGVRTSTLRFWEQEGLVLPERVTSLRARRYGPCGHRRGPDRRGPARLRVRHSRGARGHGVPGPAGRPGGDRARPGAAAGADRRAHGGAPAGGRGPGGRRRLRGGTARRVAPVGIAT